MLICGPRVAYRHYFKEAQNKTWAQMRCQVSQTIDKLKTLLILSFYNLKCKTSSLMTLNIYILQAMQWSQKTTEFTIK